MMLSLKELKPFAQGETGFVLFILMIRHVVSWFADPILPRQTADEKGFPKNLRPLSSFDDNREECRVVTQLQRQLGEIVFEHVYRCYGFIQTDLGVGFRLAGYPSISRKNMSQRELKGWIRELQNLLTTVRPGNLPVGLDCCYIKMLQLSILITERRPLLTKIRAGCETDAASAFPVRIWLTPWSRMVVRYSRRVFLQT